MSEENKTITPIVENRSSVEMSVNAKGQVSGKVKAYNDDPDIAYTEAEAILRKIQEKQEPQAREA